MPSRKRNKGKERKAKKEAKAGAFWRGWAIGDRDISPWSPGSGERDDAQCTHGCVLPPRDHAVSRFMNSFEEARRKNSVLNAMSSTVDAHPRVWNDANHRQMVVNILLSVGTNMILNEELMKIDDKCCAAVGIASAILLLDCYDGRGRFKNVYNATNMKLHLSLPMGSGKRDLLKFYSKRLPCSCLKEEYKRARKSLPKMGECWNCKQYSERASLTTCGRCKIPLYCSRECQVTHWPRHNKCDCRIYVDIQKCEEARAKK